MSKTNILICNTIDKVRWLVAKLDENLEWAVDTETSGGNFLKDHIFCISFSWKEGIGACIDFRDFKDDDLKVVWNLVKYVLENGSKKITQNGTFDVKFFWKSGIRFNNWYCDTILMDHLLDENKHHGLEHLANRYTTMGGYHYVLDNYVDTHDETNPSKNGTYLNIPQQMLDDYACQDADATYRAYKAMYPKIVEEKLNWILFNIQMPMQKILSQVEYGGVQVDIDYLNKLHIEYVAIMEKLWDKILKSPEVTSVIDDNKSILIEKWQKSKILKKKHTQNDYLELHKDKWEFKLSTKQLTALLLDKFKQEPFKFGKKINKKTNEFNASMDSEVLDHYAKTIPLCKDIQEYRTYQHLTGTFIEGMKEFIHTDNKVRSNYPLFRTVTGRPSSFQPNLNNIPRKRSEIKKQFIADPGDYLIEADLAQIEFRIWANFSNDPQMIADINAGLDIHKITAAMGKGLITTLKGDIDYKEYVEKTSSVTKEERNTAKTVVFGMMYGRGPVSIASELNITVKEAKEIKRVFFDRYPIAEKWLLYTMASTKTTGYVRSTYGRKRRLPHLKDAEEMIKDLRKKYDQQLTLLNRGVDIAESDLISEEALNEEVLKIRQLQEKAKRQSVNAPIQGGASDTNFLAAIRIYKEMKRLKLKSRMVLTVYDSLIYTVKPNELEQMLKLIHTEMLYKNDFIKVKLNCEIKIGRRWGELKEVHFDDDHNPKLEDLAKYN